MPICSKCKQDKPLTYFTSNKSRATGFNPACKDCDAPTIYKRQFEARGGPLTDDKRCNKCGVVKAYTEFRVWPRNKDGLDPACKTCRSWDDKVRYHLEDAHVHKDPVHMRFWRMVDTTGGPEACWPWQGQLDSDGYGISKHTDKGRAHKAHRVAWELTFGDIPKGHGVLHDCPSGDWPSCCNVFAHLWTGTQADNMRDCSLKERAATNLTHEQVRLIRALEGLDTPTHVAELFDIHRTTVYAIWKRLRFKHVV